MAAKFSSLTAALLPGYRFRLVPLDPHASSGIQLQYRPFAGIKADDDADAIGTCGDWDDQGNDRAGSTANAIPNGKGGKQAGRDHAPGSAAAKGGTGWGSQLDVLSGGQRSLVSLALLLAAARCGGRCSLFLLDEVDAALDESNQRAVVALLRELAHRERCQVWWATFV